MKKYDYLIIGGGIAGTTAADVIREKDTLGLLAIVGNEPYPLYSRVLLPNYLKNKIELEKVFLKKESDYKGKNIDTFFGEEVVKIDTREKKVFLKNGAEIFYNKLLIASGGTPKKADFEGVDNSEVLRFQTLDDAKKIKEKMQGAKEALVIGGSFISLELAEAFFANNINTSIFLRSGRFFSSVLDEESSEIIRKNLEEKGISVLTNKEKKGNGKKFDILAAGVGIERNLDFAESSEIPHKIGIFTNEYLETEISDVWAAGDVAEYYDSRSGKRRIEGNWLSAFLQGKTAGLNMAGERTVFAPLSGYNTNNFGLNISFIGDTIKDADTVVIARGDSAKKERTRLFLRNGVLVGAAQINLNRERGTVTMLIEKKVDLLPHFENLKDSSFNLASLIKN